MNIRKRIALCVLVVIVAAAHWLAVTEVASTAYNREKHEHCGTVLETPTKERAVKHGSHTDYYLVVNFDNFGKKAIEVSPNTYYTTEIGERVCFLLENREVMAVKGPSVLGVVCFALSLVFDLVLIASLIGHLVTWLSNFLSDDYGKKYKKL